MFFSHLQKGEFSFDATSASLSTTSPVQQVVQVAQVPEAPPDPIPGAVLLQYEHLTRGKPALWKDREKERLSDYGNNQGTYLFTIVFFFTKEANGSLSLQSSESVCSSARTTLWSKVMGSAAMNSSIPCLRARSASAATERKGRANLARRCCCCA